MQLDGNWIAAPPAGYGPVDATHPPVARSTGLQSVQITNAAIAAGANKNIPTAAAIPAYRAPYKGLLTTQITMTKPGVAGSPWIVTCTGTTATTFTGCVPVVNPAATVTPAGGATVSATIPTVDGNVVVSSALNANWAAGWGTITVVSSAAFAPRTSGCSTRITRPCS